MNKFAHDEYCFHNDFAHERELHCAAHTEDLIFGTFERIDPTFIICNKIRAMLNEYKITRH